MQFVPSKLPLDNNLCLQKPLLGSPTALLPQRLFCLRYLTSATPFRLSRHLHSKVFYNTSTNTMLVYHQVPFLTLVFVVFCVFSVENENPTKDLEQKLLGKIGPLATRRALLSTPFLYSFFHSSSRYFQGPHFHFEWNVFQWDIQTWVYIIFCFLLAKLLKKIKKKKVILLMRMKCVDFQLKL